MIGSVRGKVISKSPTSVLVETGGIGFNILIPLSSMKAVGEPGDEVMLLTHLHVREDALQLFGFATQGEKDLFLSLISISGVGPRLALGVLSGISAEDFISAIHNQDTAALSRVPGIGKKTAERLVVELKDKLGNTSGTIAHTDIRGTEEAVLALMSLGYKRNKAETVIHSLLKKDAALPLEELIRLALRAM